ncbi:nacht and wd domain protein [Penicillium hordei]|uniref:Nacht and wd domain protein n=1 Tax=Penicillium hordei TaxID=40994 RepID=A0AAD6DMZ9_9EURO|nr:nacht and wd domain protein [Penicillium hordei]KAJ5589413.1 nacht and wd domain protein [Penicillium hordei]
MNKLDPTLYRIAWIAPLLIEARAAICSFDKLHEGQFPLDRGDDHVYIAGEIGGHHAIIATLPTGQEYGNGSAAALASQIKKFFPNLWFGLLVGVAAGLPNLSIFPPRDIRLGDVLVGLPEGDHAGLIAYDLGRETDNEGLKLLQDGHVLAPTEPVIRSAIGKIRLFAPDGIATFLQHYEAIRQKKHEAGDFNDPGQDKDHFYQTDADVKRKRSTSDSDSDEYSRKIPRRNNHRPSLHSDDNSEESYSDELHFPYGKPSHESPSDTSETFADIEIAEVLHISSNGITDRSISSEELSSSGSEESFSVKHGPQFESDSSASDQNSDSSDHAE